MRRFKTLRGRLTALALVSAAAAIAVLTIAFNVLLDRSLDGDAQSRLRAKAAAAATTVVSRGGRLAVRESPDDAAVDRQVWIYDGALVLERPPAGAAVQHAADALVGRVRVFHDVPGRDLLLYAAPITHRGRRVGTVVVGQSLAAYDRTTDVALIGSLVLAFVLLGAVYVVTRVTIGRALGPVRDMTRSAADWSEHDLERRFGPTPRPDELGDLAGTFDALLDRLAASLRHEQRLSAELSHELRTPLARIVAETELLQRRERSAEDRDAAFGVIGRSAEQMSRILETLMAAARADAQLERGRSDVGETLDRLADAWEPLLAGHSVALDIRRPDGPLIAGVDEDVVERIVAPLLDNASRYARSRVVLGASAAGGRVVLTMTDDGPGIAADAREQIFEPGVRGETVNGHGGAGLGLSLARRLARAAGGDIAVVPGNRGSGAAFRIDLPA